MGVVGYMVEQDACRPVRFGRGAPYGTCDDVSSVIADGSAAWPACAGL